MKFDKNLYAGLIRRPLMTVKKNRMKIRERSR